MRGAAVHPEDGGARRVTGPTAFERDAAARWRAGDIAFERLLHSPGLPQTVIACRSM
jgi:hypothetical protein